MKASARNVFRGRVTKIEFGRINAEVSLEITPGVTTVSTITAESRLTSKRQARTQPRLLLSHHPSACPPLKRLCK